MTEVHQNQHENEKVMHHPQAEVHSSGAAPAAELKSEHPIDPTSYNHNCQVPVEVVAATTAATITTTAAACPAEAEESGSGNFISNQDDAINSNSNNNSMVNDNLAQVWAATEDDDVSGDGR